MRKDKMKLRNKKNGIIGKLYFDPDEEYHFTVLTEDPADVMIYKKLADLYAEWEDYEEPEGWWFIDRAYEPHATNSTLRNLEADRRIGNYFETKEEAEQAVEKLKAWKRLKDKGYYFKRWNVYKNHFEIVLSVKEYDFITDEVKQDLDLLFGGEE